MYLNINVRFLCLFLFPFFLVETTYLGGLTTNYGLLTNLMHFILCKILCYLRPHQFSNMLIIDGSLVCTKARPPLIFQAMREIREHYHNPWSWMQVTCPKLSTICAYMSMLATCQKIIKIITLKKLHWSYLSFLEHFMALGYYIV